MFQPQWIPASQQKLEKKLTQQSYMAAGTRNWTEAAKIIHTYFYTAQQYASKSNSFGPKQSHSEAAWVSNTYRTLNNKTPQLQWGAQKPRC